MDLNMEFRSGPHMRQMCMLEPSLLVLQRMLRASGHTRVCAHLPVVIRPLPIPLSDHMRVRAAQQV